MKRRGRVVLGVFLFAILLGMLFIRPLPRAEIELYFFDVGQGDAALLRTPMGDILIDAGPDASEEELLLRLRRLGVDRLALLILSHTDEDHVGGADGVLRTFPVDEVWVGAGTDFGEPYQRVLSELRLRSIPLYAPVEGDLLLRCGASFEILSPVPLSGFLGNNGSLVFRATYKNARMLFTGDVDGAIEEQILEKHAAELSCDVYKVPHHGSATGQNNQMLYFARPDYAVISCGVGNSYGHPHGETLALLRAAEVRILRTDRDGEIRFEYNGTSLREAS